MTLTARVLAAVNASRQCRTATEYARELGESCNTVAKTLARLAKSERVRRFRKSKLYPERGGRDAWVY